MPDDRRRRFSQIERPRAAGGEHHDPTPDTGARFGALGEPPRAAPPEPAAAEPPPADPLAGPPGLPVARGHTDRFRPAAERPLEVEDRTAASQPFVRCARCETDSSRFAARCTTCGEPLDTDQQRAFNERLWSERRAVADAEEAARAARQAALDEAQAQESVARRALAEDMARSVGEMERRRLDGAVYGEPTFGPPSERWGEGPRWGRGSGWGTILGDAGESGTPLGLRLLAALPPAWRLGVGVAAVAGGALLFLLHPTAGLVAGMVLLGLFLPSRRRWGRGGWW